MFSLLLICLMGNASPHTSFPEAVDKRTVRHLLSSSERSQDLKKLGPEGYKQLRAIMFSPSEKIEHRWNAVLSLAKIGGTDSLADVEKALKDSTWYMRSAGLLATRLIDKQMGQARAKELMSHDPALMVRASALQVLAQDEKVDRPYLWSQLKNPRNFNNGRGLSIRESILQVLGQNVQKKRNRSICRAAQ